MSFTFDDFPRTALHTGGAILRAHGARGTYYASFGSMGHTGPSGALFLAEDLPLLVEEGHELGCHTYGHSHAWETGRRAFEQSILLNRAELDRLLPGTAMDSLSYPISCPRPANKRVAAKYYTCCRGGGQVPNIGWVDASNLYGYFLEQDDGSMAKLRAAIDRVCQANGWLILATHEVCDNPSNYGCTTRFFEDLVSCVANSGAALMPVAEAWRAITPPAHMIL